MPFVLTGADWKAALWLPSPAWREASAGPATHRSHFQTGWGFYFTRWRGIGHSFYTEITLIALMQLTVIWAYLASFKSYYSWWWNRSTYMEKDFYEVRLIHISAFLACKHAVTPEMFVSRSLSCTRSRLISPCSGRFMRQPESSPSRSTSANQWGKADCSSVNVKRRSWKSCRMRYWNTASTTAVSLHRPVILPDREVSQSTHMN